VATNALPRGDTLPYFLSSERDNQIEMKRVVFIPEAEAVTSKSGETVCKHSLSPEISSHLTGYEARSFYESLVSNPIEGFKDGPPRRRRRLTRKKRADWTKGKNINEEPKNGPSTSEADLFFCVQNNQVSQFKKALDQDSSVVNMKDKFQWSLLMVAAFAGHRDMVELLLERGAEWEGVVDRKGRGAVELARLGGFPNLADRIEISKRRQDRSVESPRHGREEQLVDRTGEFEDVPQYTCDCCQATMSGRCKSSHTASMVHLFNCQFGNKAAPSYGISERNRGYQMLLHSGWDPERGLGPYQQGKLFPVKTILKQDRAGLGGREGRARVTHFSAHDREAVKTDREKYRTHRTKKKSELLKDRRRERQWEMRTRAMLNS